MIESETIEHIAFLAYKKKKNTHTVSKTWKNTIILMVLIQKIYSLQEEKQCQHLIDKRKPYTFQVLHTNTQTPRLSGTLEKACKQII